MGKPARARYQQRARIAARRVPSDPNVDWASFVRKRWPEAQVVGNGASAAVTFCGEVPQVWLYPLSVQVTRELTDWERAGGCPARGCSWSHYRFSVSPSWGAEPPLPPTWGELAARRWPGADVQGDGRYAFVAFCGGWGRETVRLSEKKDDPWLDLGEHCGAHGCVRSKHRRFSLTGSPRGRIG